MKVVETFAAARVERHGVSGLVPTMGYLHEGHLSLMTAAAAECDTVIASLFVNPLQFAPDEDLRSYPRDLDRDVELAAAAGVDVLFAPTLDEMYPEPPSTRVTVAALSLGMEGAFRPGHFEGVATVVTKLLGGLQPDRAYFGRKDAQQLAVVRRLVRDLSLPVTVVACPIVRDADGLALSSRNVYLDGDARPTAVVLSAGLLAAADAVEAGERDAAALEGAVQAAATGTPGLELQYVELADAVETIRLPRLDREAFLAAAALVAGTRLIDNIWFTPTATGFAPDRGWRLEQPSGLIGRTPGGG